jgi:glycosyltransferase involved in cell wall biosynthesis
MRKLVLFPELYTTLAKQQRFGLLVRNMVQYVKFIERNELDEFLIFSYAREDQATLEELQRAGIFPKSFRVLTPPAWLGSKYGQLVYSIIGPWLHRHELRGADAFRTQQVTGAWSALIAKALFRKPLLFRLGYPLSVRFASEGKKLNYKIAHFVERLLVRHADHVAVTSRIMQRYYGAMDDQANVTVLPNYVDLDYTAAIDAYDPKKPAIFVGRLEPVKNIQNIIKACAAQKLPLHLYYGGGELEQELRALAASLGADVEFKGAVPNRELLKIHHRHAIFMLCSTREGMPKALIEAMASGLICVVTPTDGASELVTDGVTGYVAKGYDADAIAEALSRALAEMNPEIGRNARQFVVNNLSLEHAVEQELAILKKIVARATSRSSVEPATDRRTEAPVDRQAN